MHEGDDDLAAAALGYAARGWHVLPCDPQSKHPLIERGLYAATTDAVQIEAWWRQWPAAMIGIRTGHESGIIVLDVDVDRDEQVDGFISIAELEKKHGMLPDTLHSTTPRGGEHLYFKWHDGIRNNTGKLGDHIDVRGRNGFVIVPPSIRSDRKAYSWREDCAAEPVEAPAWLIELLTTVEPAGRPAPTSTPTAVPRSNGNGDAYARAALNAECAKVTNAPKGQRNQTLNVAAFSLGQLVGADALTEGEVTSRLFDAASVCGLVKDDGALATNNTIKSGLNAGMKQPRTIPEPTASTSPIKPETLAALVAIATQPPTTTAPVICATPFAWREPAKIPRRAWLYAKHYIRKYLSCTIAPGGYGKTSLIIVEALTIATGRPLLDITPNERARVWYWNGEDPADEVDRRITAAMIQHDVTWYELDGYLFRDTGRETPIILAKQDRSGTTIAKPVIDAVIETIKHNDIGVLIIDPFVKSHKVSENDNVAIDIVATQWAQIADITNCAIELLHHPRKTSGGIGITIEDARGAVALIDAARAARVLNKMSEKEAENIGIEIKTVWRYLRLDDGKTNMAPPAEKADWYKLESVTLDNGDNVTLDNGDNVGVVVSWKYPDPFEGITVHDLRQAQKAVSEGGPWRADPQAEAWVGIPIAKAIRLDINKNSDRKKIRKLLETWIENQMFVEAEEKDKKRKWKKFIKVGKWAD
jgi:hypothetical protein